MAASKIKSWFDRLDSILTAEAELIGLFNHSSMVGAGREFIVSRVLRSFLPASVHVGSGRVVSSMDDCESRQVDIVIYDPRFPLLESGDGLGIYFVEGVIATVEVKSSLKTDTLKDAVENCRSVSELRSKGQNQDEKRFHVQQLASSKGIDFEEANELFDRAIRPSTYIFGFKNLLSPHAAREVVNAVDYNKTRFGALRLGPIHPSVIASPGLIALSADGITTIHPSDDDYKAVQQQSGEEARIVMAFWEAAKPFGILASHIMAKVTRRLGTYVWGEGVSLTIRDYIPIRAYLEEYMINKSVKYIVWTPDKTDAV